MLAAQQLAGATTGTLPLNWVIERFNSQRLSSWVFERYLRITPVLATGVSIPHAAQSSVAAAVG